MEVRPTHEAREAAAVQHLPTTGIERAGELEPKDEVDSDYIKFKIGRAAQALQNCGTDCLGLSAIDASVQCTVELDALVELAGYSKPRQNLAQRMTLVVLPSNAQR